VALGVLFKSFALVSVLFCGNFSAVKIEPVFLVTPFSPNLF